MKKNQLARLVILVFLNAILFSSKTYPQTTVCYLYVKSNIVQSGYQADRVFDESLQLNYDQSNPFYLSIVHPINNLYNMSKSVANFYYQAKGSYSSVNPSDGAQDICWEVIGTLTPGKLQHYFSGSYYSLDDGWYKTNRCFSGLSETSLFTIGVSPCKPESEFLIQNSKNKNVQYVFSGDTVFFSGGGNTVEYSYDKTTWNTIYGGPPSPFVPIEKSVSISDGHIIPIDPPLPNNSWVVPSVSGRKTIYFRTRNCAANGDVEIACSPYSNYGQDIIVYPRPQITITSELGNSCIKNNKGTSKFKISIDGIDALPDNLKSVKISTNYSDGVQNQNNNLFTDITNNFQGVTQGTFKAGKYIFIIEFNDEKTIFQNFTLNEPPAISLNSIVSICGSGTATLTAISTGTINWYNVLTGGASLKKGNSYTTPVISSTTNYYIDVTGNGCTSTPRQSVTAKVNALPKPSFTVEPGSNACLNSDVTYTTQPSMPNYAWGIPGTKGTDYTIATGGAATNNSVTLKWLKTGSKTVTINYTDKNQCTAAAATSSTATVIPSGVNGGTIGGIQQICSGGDPSAFTNVASPSGGYGGWTYNWESKVGTGAWASIDSTNSLTYDAPAGLTQTTTYRRKASRSCGSAYSNEVTVTVNALPEPSFTVEPGSNACLNSDVTYTTQPSMPNYAWGIPGTKGTDYTITSGGTTTNNTVTLRWLKTGSKTVTINYTDGNQCMAAAATSSTATVIPPGVNGGAIGGIQQICSGGDPSAFTNVASPSGGYGGWTYSWESKVGTGAWASINSINSLTYDVPVGLTQTTTYRRKASRSCGSAYSNEVTVTVNPLPIPTIAGPNKSCTGSSEVYSTESGMSNYSWSISGGGSIISDAGTNQVTIIWNEVWSHSVRVNYKNSYGCSAQSMATISVGVSPSPSPIIVGLDNTCIGNVEVYSTSDGMNGYSWFVSSGGKIISGEGTKQISVIWNEIGNQIVSVNYTTSSGCTAQGATEKNVIVHALPDVILSSSDNKFCSGTSITFTATPLGMTNYQFMVNGAIKQNDTSNTYTTASLTNGDEVVVTATNTNGCSNSSTGISNTVYVLPETATGTNASRCNAGEITLTATPGTNGNAIRWYDNATEGSLLVESDSLTQNFDTTQTYYAESYNSNTGCVTSQRTAIKGIVVPQAEITSQPSNLKVLRDSSGTFTVGATNALVYQWEVMKNGTSPWEVVNDGPLYNGSASQSLNLNSVPFSENGNKYRCRIFSTPCNEVVSDAVLLQVSDINVDIIKSNLVCKNDSNGSIKAIITKGITPYEVILKDNNGSIISTLNEISDTATFTNLKTGLYDVIVVDAASFNKTISNIEILNPDSLLAVVESSTNPSCYGLKNGSFMVSTFGGWGNYIYEVNGDSTTNSNTFNNLACGNYTIKVTDKLGCSTTITHELIQPSVLKIAVDSTVDPKCYGWNNGKIILKATGGTKNYTFTVGTTTSADSTFSNLNAGSYKCLVTDANSCIDSTEALLSQNDSISYFIQSNNYGGFNIACFGGKDSLKLKPSGGNAPYEILFDTINYVSDTTGVSFNSLFSRIYNVSIKDSDGCQKTGAINFSQPEELKISLLSITNATCYGMSNGSILVKVTGGVSPYLFTISNSKNEIVKENSQDSPFELHTLAADSYNIQIADANGCSISDNFVIAEPSLLSISILTTNVKCFDGQDGSAKAFVTGGTAPYSYQWINESNEVIGTDATLYNLKAANWQLRVTDSNGCSGDSAKLGYIEEIATIKNPNSTLIFNTKTTPVSCNGGSTGTIKIIPEGGWKGYRFSMNGTIYNTVDSISGLPSGLYNIFVKDSMGCIESRLDTIKEQTTLNIDSIYYLNATCNGYNNGKIKVMASGGTPNYRYFINDIEFNGYIDTLLANEYTLTVKDTNECSTFAKVTINQPDAIEFTSKTYSPTCGLSNGAVTITPYGGNGNLSVLWEYDGTIRDSLPNITSGNYAFSITDETGCTTQSVIPISNNGGPVINLYDQTAPLCYLGSDGKIRVEISTGTLPIKYILKENNITVDSISIATLPFIKSYNDLSDGKYAISATDLNGCFSGKNFEMKSPADIVLSPSKIDISCKGENSGIAEVFVTGGTEPYTIEWFDSENNLIGTGNQISSLQAGVYTARVNDANGCPSSKKMATVNLAEPQAPLMFNTTKSDVLCNGESNGSVSIQATGGWGNYLYSKNKTDWSSTNIIENLPAGTFNIYVQDNKGCIANAAVSIEQNPAVTINISSTDITCQGDNNGKIEITANGGTDNYLYSINNGISWDTKNLFENLSVSNSYKVKVKDSNECKDSAIATINEPTKLELEIAKVVPLKCYGTSSAQVTLKATGGVQNYLFGKNNDSYITDSIFSNLGAANYTFSVKDSNGCISSVNQNIANPEQFVLSVSSFNNVSCYGGNDGNITLSQNGGIPYYKYSLDGDTWKSDNQFTGLSAGNYTITAIDGNNCSATIEKSIAQPNILSIQVDNYNNITCNGLNNGSLQLSANGGTAPYNFSIDEDNWQNNGFFSNLTPQDYTIIVKDAKECVAILNKQLTEPLPINISNTVNQPTCYGYNNGKITVSVTGGTTPYVYSWSNGSIVSTTGAVKAGSYTLLVTDKNNCQKEEEFSVENPEKIIFDLPKSEIICSNQTLTLNAGYPDANHRWLSDNGFSSNKQIVTVNNTGNYFLTVTDNKGCTGRDTVNLTQKDIDIEADFMLTDKASVYDTIAVIDISWPLPDSIEWSYSDVFSVYKTDSWSAYIIPEEAGEYTVGLITYLMGCHQSTEKNIVISTNPTDGKKEITTHLDIIKDIIAYPNPSNGQFNVLVNLNRDAEVIFELYSIYGKKLLLKKASGLDRYKFDVSIKQNPGIYLIRVSSGNEFRNIRVVIQ